jgi:hypothetical protein
VTAILKPVIGAVVVVSMLAVLRDYISDASIRSALGWSTASVVTETMLMWVGRRKRSCS